MQRTTMQVPISKDLKESAEKAALDYGFSSLQEVLMKFMNKLAHRKVNVYALDKEEEVIYLSQKSEKRYLKAMENLKNGKDIYTAKSVEEFFDQLSKP